MTPRRSPSGPRSRICARPGPAHALCANPDAVLPPLYPDRNRNPAPPQGAQDRPTRRSRGTTHTVLCRTDLRSDRSPAAVAALTRPALTVHLPPGTAGPQLHGRDRLVTTPAAQEAARRAWTLAQIAERRIPGHPAEPALAVINDLLTTASVSLRQDAPCEGGMIPDEAWVALTQADLHAAKHPDTGFPSRLSAYIEQPLSSEPLPMPDRLEPENPTLADAETQLQAALGAIHAQLTTATAPIVIDALLESVLILHGTYNELADATAREASSND